MKISTPIKPIYSAYALILLFFFIQDSRGQSTKTDFSITFILTTQNNIAIKAMINGQDTVTLMFHTAANALTLTEEAINKMKSLHFEGADSVKSWGGANNSSRFSKNNSLQIGEKKWENIPLWEDLNSGHGTGGKFGPEIFENKVIEIDFDHKIIKVSNHLPANARAYERLELNFKDDMMFVSATSKIGNDLLPHTFLIHSGYSGAVLFDDEFTAKNQLDSKLVVISEKELKDAFGNILKTKKAVMQGLILGKTSLADVPVGFFQGAIGRQKMSIIGCDLLKRFNMIISADRTAIYLRPNKLSKLPYSNS
jgi:hypothetical protein